MSLSDTIDAIIKESSSVERELRWFLSALPAIVSTEVMGPGIQFLPRNRIRDSSAAMQSATRPYMYRIKILC